jgi:hypothetical protein
MRVSVLEGDPGYIPFRESARYRVLLNGFEIGRCVTADEEIGMVTVIGVDEHERLIVRDGEVQYRRYVGNVEIQRVGPSDPVPVVRRLVAAHVAEQRRLTI